MRFTTSMLSRPDQERGRRPVRSTRSGEMTLLSVAASVAVLAAGTLCYAFADDRGKVLVLSLEASLACVVAYVGVVRLLPQPLTPRLLIASYQLQLLSLALIAGLGLPLSPPYHPFEISVSDAPLRVAAAMLMVPLAVVVGVLCCRVLKRSAPLDAGSWPDADLARRRRLYLVVAAVSHLLYWPATLEGAGVLGYVCRIVATALLAAPFIAGRDSATDRPLAGLWIVTIVINAVVGIVAGTRSRALVAAVLFVAGYISALPRKRRFAVATGAAIAAIPLVQLSGAVGVVRDQVGRGGLELMRADHAAQVFQEITRQLTDDDREQAEEVRAQGVSRMLAWTNVVVPLMTPDSIPYRGFAGFVDEGMETFRIASVTGLTADDFYDAGLSNAAARRYGFTVNGNTSVEFTLLADAWSRGGPAAVVVFTLLVMILLLAAEWCCTRIVRDPGVATVLVLPLAKAAFFDANTSPVLVLLRGVLLSVIVVVTLVAVVEFAPRRLRRSVRQGDGGAGRNDRHLRAAAPRSPGHQVLSRVTTVASPRP